MVDAIFTLSLLFAHEQPYLPEGGFYTCPVPWFLWLLLRRQFCLPVFEVQEYCDPGSHRTPPIREIVLGRLLTETPSFWERGLFACPKGWPWGTGLWCGTLVGGCTVPSGYRLMDIIFELSFCSAVAHWYLPERSLYTHLEPQVLQLLTKRHLQIAWVW